MEEHWQPIQDFPNYHISTFGNIKNIITHKLLKPCNKAGYYHVSLVNSITRKSLKIHRLVSIAFIPNPENKPEVNHKDKNKFNNNINNLEWVTKSENMSHCFKDMIVTCNKNKPINRIDKENYNIIQSYNSIEEAALWAFENKLTKNIHNGRNSIGNCLRGLSTISYGFRWEFITEQDLENEVWKQVCVENSGNKTYFVSNLGRFKNSKGRIMDNYKLNNNGYIRVFICNKTYVLHRLIALAFIDNPENKSQVNHIDGNKINNAVNNLEWVTCQENQIHKHKTGLGNNYTRKIVQYTSDNIFIKEYKSIALASKETNISKSSISGVLRGKRKTSGGFVWKYLD
jgi:hypothetical protein